MLAGCGTQAPGRCPTSLAGAWLSVHCRDQPADFARFAQTLPDQTLPDPILPDQILPDEAVSNGLSGGTLIVGWAFRLRIAGFFFHGELAEAIIDPGDQLLESIDLTILLENHAIERFEIVLEVQAQALEGDQARFEGVSFSHHAQ